MSDDKEFHPLRRKDFLWEIKSWESVSKLGTSQGITSPTFYVGDAQWQVELYPNGKNDDYKNFMSVSLTYLNYIESANVVATVSLVNDFNYLTTVSKKVETIITKCENGLNFQIDYPDFILNSPTGKNIKKILSRDRIYLLCQMRMFDLGTVYEEPVVKVKTEPGEDLSLDVEEDKFESLTASKAFSDVTFKIEDKEIFAHKVIVANKSTVFNDIFKEDGEKENKNIYEISDTKYNIFKEMLRFIYTNKVNELEKVAVELMVAADKYCIEPLKLICEEFIAENITLTSVIKCIELAINCKSNLLKTEITEFILSNKRLIINLPEFKLIPKKYPDFMYDMFKKLVAENCTECIKKKPKKNIKKLLDNVQNSFVSPKKKKEHIKIDV